MTRTRMTIGVVLLLALAAWAQKDFPSGWHKPTAQELGARGDKDLVVKADFDGDGKPDTAYILTDDRERTVGVLAFLSSTSRWAKGDGEKIAELQKWAITELPAGEYKTACDQKTEDYECSTGVGDAIKLEHPAVKLTVKGGPTVVFSWDAASEGLKHALIASGK